MISLELEERYANLVSNNLTKAGFGDQVSYMTGPALQSLEQLVGGSVVDQGAKPKRYTEFMKIFSETVANHPQLQSLLIPIGDGLSISKSEEISMEYQVFV